MNVESTLQNLLEIVRSMKDQMVTKSDLVYFATKDDLKNFATKDDLKNFATKDDLKNFATKDDLKNFPTRDDLREFAKKDDFRHFATKDDLFAFKSDILTHIDGFTSLYKITEAEIAALRAKSDRMESHIFQLARHAQLELQ